MAVFLTQEIENDEGYVDQVVRNVKAVQEGEDLEMEICCVGGDTFQGARLQRSVLEHEGKTKAVIIGLAASMGTSVLSAFDEVEIDEHAELMFHKARIVGVEEYTPEQKLLIDRFNDKTYQLLSEKGVNEEFLNKVFKSEDTNDHWITAKEAEELGIGKVVKIERKDSKPYKVAASLNIEEIKNKYEEQMGLFSKAVTQIVNLKGEEGTLVFTSKEKELKVGDMVNKVGSSEKLNGKFTLQNGMVAEVEDDKVVNMEEEEPETSEVTREEYEELKSMVEDIAKSMKEMVNSKPSEDEEETMKAELENKLEAVNNQTEQVSGMVNTVVEAIKAIQPEFKLEKLDEKHEQKQDEEFIANLSDAEKQAYDLRNALKDEKKDK